MIHKSSDNLFRNNLLWIHKSHIVSSIIHSHKSLSLLHMLHLMFLEDKLALQFLRQWQWLVQQKEKQLFHMIHKSSGNLFRNNLLWIHKSHILSSIIHLHKLCLLHMLQLMFLEDWLALQFLWQWQWLVQQKEKHLFHMIHKQSGNLFRNNLLWFHNSQLVSSSIH